MELNIDDNTRESLKHNNSLENWKRLETVLKTWIESHSSPVTWENVIHIIIKKNEIKKHCCECSRVP